MTLQYKNYTRFVREIGVIFLLIIFCVLSSAKVNAQHNANGQNDIYLHMFYGQGCPHCSKLRLFLDDMENKYPSLKIYEHEVYQDNEKRELFERMSKDFNVPIEGVPTVFIDDRVIVGFSNAIGVSIENQIKRCLEISCNNPEFKQATPETTQLVGESSPSFDPEKKEVMQKLTIPVVIFAATVDAINPCAFAVLIILMTAALSIANKKGL